LLGQLPKTVSLRHDQVYNEWPSPTKRQGVVC